MNLIKTIPIFLIYTTLVVADHVTNIDNEKLILSCEDGPCNKPNLNGFECSYTRVNDNYKYICISEKVSLWNNYNLENELSTFNLNKFFIWYVLFVTILLLAIIQLKIFYKFVNYVISM